MHIPLMSTYPRQELRVAGRAIRENKLTDGIRRIYGNAISEVEDIYIYTGSVKKMYTHFNERKLYDV